jgi:hypothetical protein
MSQGSPLRDENVAAIDDANLECSGKCRAAIFKGVGDGHGSPLAHENVAAIDSANLDCSGKCRAAIFKGE